MVRIRGELQEAKKHPIVYTEDCPESTPEALAEFAAMARELRKRKEPLRRVIALRLKPDVLAKYKALGKGYTGIMADVLNYVVDNPEILSKVH
ncbi:MAG: BrnA antitoxin family protein [Treponema sp.]|nr:BrnA antitoxin family protein [Treponema sp.]